MPLGIVQLKGSARPAFICEQCGKEIIGAGMGNYLWYGRESVVTDIKYVHKSCTPSYEATFGEVEGIMELDYLLIHLLKTTGMMGRKKIKDAVERAVFTESID